MARTRDKGRVDNGRRPWIEIDKTEEGWQWVLWSENGIALATNAKPYQRRNNCTDAIKLWLGQIGPHTEIMVRAGIADRGINDPSPK